MGKASDADQLSHGRLFDVSAAAELRMRPTTAPSRDVQGPVKVWQDRPSAVCTKAGLSLEGRDVLFCSSWRAIGQARENGCPWDNK